jgi:hypothetical protein
MSRQLKVAALEARPLVYCQIFASDSHRRQTLPFHRFYDRYCSTTLHACLLESRQQSCVLRLSVLDLVGVQGAISTRQSGATVFSNESKFVLSIDAHRRLGGVADQFT